MKVAGKEFYICKGSRPKVLLLGNGINRAFGDGSWTDFLNAIQDKNKYPLDADKYIMPMNLKAAMLSNGMLEEKLRDFNDRKNGKYTCDKQGLLDLLSRLLSVPFDYILTTNYSYEIELALSGKTTLRKEEIAGMMDYTEGKGAETQYFLHTYNSVDFNGRNSQIWHIHGEFRKPKSMVLGQYYYGNLLCRYGDILNSHTRDYAINLKKAEPQKISSWVDAFMLGDAYIAGLGMDFSETDLWWLLERKSLQKPGIAGKTVFYAPIKKQNSHCRYDRSMDCGAVKDWKEENECRDYLLDTYGVEYRNLGVTIDEHTSYEDFYHRVLDDLSEEI